MSDEVKTPDLNSGSALDRVQKLSGAIARYRGESETSKAEARELKREVERLSKENADLAIKADTSVAAKKVEELTAQLRQMKTRQAFDKAALAKDADPKALDDLWTLAKIAADKDEPDTAAIGAVIDEQAKLRAWAFAPPAQVDPNAPPPLKPATGSGQGAPANGSPIDVGLLPESDPRMSDAAWLMRNATALQESRSKMVADGKLIGTSL